MSINHPYASGCIEVINRLANQWGIILPEGSIKLTPFRSPEIEQAAPNMSLFFTQATLSSESIDSLVAPSTNIRHDSGSIFEPSFVPHNMPILAPQDHASAAGVPQHSLQSTPMHTTPVQAQSHMWPQFTNQQMTNSGMQVQMPVPEYQMMNVDHSGTYGFQGYPPAS